MNKKTYSFRAKNFTTKEVVCATVTATCKEFAQNAAMMDTRFKGWEILFSTFRVVKKTVVDDSPYPPNMENPSYPDCQKY